MTAPGVRLRRSRSGAVLGGVCAGVARSAGLDVLLLRVAVVAATVLTGGVGIPAYLLAWVLIPREPAGAPLAGPEPTVPDGAVPPPRSPLAATDPAATRGDRRQASPARTGARRAAAGVARTVSATADGPGRRLRREPG
jgi:phage shock protein C